MLKIIAIIFFICIIISFIYIILKKKNIDELLKNNKIYYTLVILVFLIGIFARVYKFDSILPAVNQDEAMAGYEAYSLSLYGTDRFGLPHPAYFTAWKTAQMNVLMSNLMIPFIKVFGLNAISIRLPNLIVSILILLVFFKLMEKLFGRKAGIIGLILISINPWNIIQSRWTLECNIFPHLILIAILLLYYGINNKKRYLYISAAVFGLSMYGYGIAYFTIPLILLITYILLLCYRKIKIKDVIISFLAYMFIAWPIFGVMAINYFKLSTVNLGFVSMSFFPNNVRMSDIIIFSHNKLGDLIFNANNLFQILSQTYVDDQNIMKQYGSIYSLSIPFALIGIIYIINKIINRKNKINNDISDEQKNKYIIMVVIFVWFLVGIMTGLIVNQVNINRINILFYPLLIIVAIGINTLISNIKILKKFENVILSIVLVLYFVLFAGFEKEYLKNRNEIMSKSFYLGYNEAINYANSINDKRIYITDYTQTNYSPAVSEILTLFYLKVDPKIYQNKTLYQNIYKYVNFNSYNFDDVDNNNDKSGSKVFVFNIAEISKFDSSKYNIKVFENYGVATLKD